MIMRRSAFAAVLFSALSACTSAGSLRSAAPDAPISGTVTRGVLEPHDVEVTLEGKTYRGEWRTLAPTLKQKEKTPYPHRYHVGRVESTLTAPDGSRLVCNWLTHGYEGEGSCRAPDRREFKLLLQ
jgi:hypothetical protein